MYFLTCPSLGLPSDRISHTQHEILGRPGFDKIDQMAFGEDFFAKQCWDMIKATCSHNHKSHMMLFGCCYEDLTIGSGKTGICLVFFLDSGFGIYHPFYRRFGYFQGSFVQACVFFHQIQAHTLSPSIKACKMG